MPSDSAKLLTLAVKLKEVKQSLEDKIDLVSTSVSAIKIIEGPQGKDGKDGKNGTNGRDGKDGINGKDGLDGKDGINGQDGVSVVDANIDFDGRLVFILSNGNEIDAGNIDISNQSTYNTFSSVSKENDMVYTTRFDQYDATVAYKGEALPSSSEDSPVWRIQKIVIINSDITITWASGRSDFAFVWSDRLSLNYI